MEIVLLIRNYNRPEYLKKTLNSILKSDIDLCKHRYIFDDGSNDDKTLELLKDKDYISQNKKEFEVLFNDENVGCSKSFVNALNYLKEKYEHTNTLICTIDNDVEVKPHFINTLKNAYLKAKENFHHQNMILTGFNPSNAHLNKINENEDDDFYQKISIGAVNYFFHISFIDNIINSWPKRPSGDWGVIRFMRKNNYPVLCLKKSVLNHIGEIGIFSKGKHSYDHDKNF